MVFLPFSSFHIFPPFHTPFLLSPVCPLSSSSLSFINSTFPSLCICPLILPPLHAAFFSFHFFLSLFHFHSFHMYNLLSLSVFTLPPFPSFCLLPFPVSFSIPSSHICIPVTLLFYFHSFPSLCSRRGRQPREKQSNKMPANCSSTCRMTECRRGSISVGRKGVLILRAGERSETRKKDTERKEGRKAALNFISELDEE